MTRPKKEETLAKTKDVHLRMNETEYDLLAERAKANRMTVSDFVRSALDNQKVIIKYEITADVPEIKKLVAVGGTATSIAHAFSGQKTYVPEVIQGLKVEKSFLDPFVLLLSTKTTEERGKLFEDKKRARVIVCGGALLSAVLKYLNLGEFYASEADNLEGYCLLKTGAL